MRKVSAELDDLDYRLILEIQDDPRCSFRKLSRKLRASQSTVRRRLSALLSSGTVTISAIIPDPFKIGYNVIAFIGLHVSPSSFEATARRLVELPDVQYACVSAGHFDFLIWSYFPSTAKLDEFIVNVIGQIPGIVKTETMILLRRLKSEPGVSRVELASDAVSARASSATEKPRTRPIASSGKQHLARRAVRSRTTPRLKPERQPAPT